MPGVLKSSEAWRTLLALLEDVPGKQRMGHGLLVMIDDHVKDCDNDCGHGGGDEHVTLGLGLYDRMSL